jgi:phage terminase large subunit-like protein
LEVRVVSLAAEPDQPGGGWWGGGPPPHLRWPGVTIRVDDCGGKYHFDAALADRACNWFPRYCSHAKGAEFAGAPFNLLDYQGELILRPLFGWVRADGTRRFRKAYIEIPKKNGKTQLVAGLGLYMLLADNEPGAEVYVAAADREQARILFKAAVAMVEANPALSKRLVIYKNSIVRKDDPTAFFQVLSSEAATKHGPNIHCLIIDELHAQPDRDLFETLTRGVIARRQPLILLITTAGDDDESICFEEYEYAKGVLSGAIEDEQHLPVIFEATAEDDPFSPAVWARVNPALGHTVKEDALAAFAREAFNEPRKRNDFLRYHLNRWVNQATAWIPVDWWDACDEPMPPDEVLATMPGAVGIDMAQKIDLAAEAAVFRLPLAPKRAARADGADVDAPLEVETVVEQDDGTVVKKKRSLNYRIAIKMQFWLPEDTLRERAKKDGVRYDIYVQNKELQVTDGAIIDSEAIVEYTKSDSGKPDLVGRYPLLKQARFGYDPAFATEIALDLRDLKGLTVVEVLQNYKHLTEACQVFEALVKAGRVIHGGHKLLRWNVENVAIKTDDAGRIRPVKPRKQTKRIDGVVAVLIALSQLMLTPDLKPRKRGRARVWTPAGWKDASGDVQTSV